MVTADGVPDRVRTCNLQLRRLSRYPIVPRGQKLLRAVFGGREGGNISFTTIFI